MKLLALEPRSVPAKHAAIAGLMLGLSLVSTVTSLAQERGIWRASSSTARAITSDIAFWNEKIVINFINFPYAQIRHLTTDEITAAFNADGATDGVGNLYRLNIPAARTFAHKNTLCGSDDVQWFATYTAGKSMQLAFFSGSKMPEFTPESLNNSTSLCGTFSYVR